MSNFKIRSFNECDINDPFFESLKEDYPGFENWFKRKSEANEPVYIYFEDGIQAFLYIKNNDCEEIIKDFLPKERRIKIGTLKISEGLQGQRLGEGAIGIALWRWQQSDVNEIYVTVFEKHDKLIKILESFGFEKAGKKENDECVYVKDKRKIMYDTPKHSFPYLDPNFSRGKYIPINDEYHDKLFQYSELKNVHRGPEDDALAASNGLTKVFIATPLDDIDYSPGDIVIIYRKHTGSGQKMYISAATSFCTIIKQVIIKKTRVYEKTLDEFISIAGNKTVYSNDELIDIYENRKTANLIVIEMVYNGYFGSGNNVNYNSLSGAGLFEGHPYRIELTRDDILKILEMGKKHVQDIIIDKPRTC